MNTFINVARGFSKMTEMMKCLSCGHALTETDRSSKVMYRCSQCGTQTAVVTAPTGDMPQHSKHDSPSPGQKTTHRF